MNINREDLLKIRNMDPVARADLLTKVVDDTISLEELLAEVRALQIEDAENFSFVTKGSEI
ncbi:MAG: hypothetical protein PHN37_01125 [Candidatus Pacebacteria bacterium]|nr:hypothetical protein [Candidatus Paceibacterota bacterium]